MAVASHVDIKGETIAMLFCVSVTIGYVKLWKQVIPRY